MEMQGKYAEFALVKEMFETVDVVKNFKIENVEAVVEAIKAKGKVFLTGEGSSRIFPAKNVMRAAMSKGLKTSFATEGSCQATEYDLSDFVVLGASNSGQTKETITLFNKLKAEGHESFYALTANLNTKLESIAKQGFVLSCGKEDAVAATKSVVEQALFYSALIAKVCGCDVSSELDKLANAIDAALKMEIPAEMIEAIANAGTIYFAGRNDGVAEELTLKTNEITRKKSDYLEGTYAVHGIEEVMNSDDVLIIVDPFMGELDKFKASFTDVVGMKVFAISNQDTIFPTLKIDYEGCLSPYVYLAMGWNILVEVGINLGIDLDKPVRARKVGNEFVG